MKMIAFAAAGLIAAGTLSATPADAQRHGWQDGRGWDDGRGFDRGRGWDRGRRWDRGRGWDRGRRWNGGRRYAGGGYYGRPRVTCRWVRSYYGPERRCFSIYR